jgi:glutathione S-transferase
MEELGLKYDIKSINIMKNEQKEPDFLEINPNGRIPALKDGNLRVFESCAIMLYICDHYDPKKEFTYEYGTSLYYEMLSWIMFQMGGIGPMQGQANHFRAMAPVYSEYGIKRYLDETKRLYGVLEIRLSKADWLAGDKYTIADMANYAWTRGGGPWLDIDMSAFPGVQKWLKRIEDRPAVKKARGLPEGGRSEEELLGMIKSMKEKMDTKKGEKGKSEL